MTDLRLNVPKWIDQASIALTIFLFWFGSPNSGFFCMGLTCSGALIRYWA